MRSILLGTVSLLAFTLFSCAERDIDKIGAAQNCVNTATETTADACLEKVSGLQSAEAYQIRCTIHYIKQGFGDGGKFGQIFQKMADSKDDNPILAASSDLAFEDKNGTSAKDLVAAANADCKKSGSAGLVLIASISSTATTLKSVTTVENPTTEDLKDAISNLAGEDASTVGDAVLAINQSYCGASGTSDESVCAGLTEAIGNDTDSESVGNKAKCLLEFDYTTELLVATSTKGYSECKECNRLHCRAIVEAPGATTPTCNGGSYQNNCS